MSEPANDPSAIRRVLDRIGNPLKWSEVNRCTLVASTTAVFIAICALLLWLSIENPEAAAFVDRHHAVVLLRYLYGMLAGWVLAISLGLAIRRRVQESRALVYFTTLFYSFNVVIGMYYTGFFTSPYGASIIMGGTIIAHLFFGPRPTWVGFSIGLASLVVTTWASHQGLLPYAPLLSRPPYDAGRLSPWWTLSMGAVAFTAALVLLPMASYVITRWKEGEEKLLEAHVLLQAQKDELVRAESLATVGSLVTGAAHELRNPLASSSGLLQGLREDIAATALGPAEKQDTLKTLDMAMKGQQRAALIAERLYSLSDSLTQKDAPRPLAMTLESLRKRFPQVQFAPSEIPPNIALNDRSIMTVLSNLFENALAAGGERPPTLEVRAEGQVLRFAVSDSGRGIPKTIQGDVFKPFFTGQKAGEGHGVGLGLYIVHELVTRMGGTAELESEEGRGTKVTLKVPFPQSPSPA